MRHHVAAASCSSTDRSMRLPPTISRALLGMGGGLPPRHDVRVQLERRSAVVPAMRRLPLSVPWPPRSLGIVPASSARA
jgi:hypothetical protein